MRSCLNECVSLRHKTTAETLEFIFAQGRAKVKLGTTRNVSSYDDYGMTCDRNVTKSNSL